jgi:DNA polymerase I-like protein with 3'-5' exonuclease and polymerase domains
METYGVYIDEEKLREIGKKLRSEREQKEKEIYNTV